MSIPVLISILAILQLLQTPKYVIISNNQTPTINMNKYNISELMDDALNSKSGESIQLADYDEAKKARRKFYLWRDRQRANGNKQYNALSFIAQPNGELWIIRRDLLNKPQSIYAYDKRQLNQSELPSQILARGCGMHGSICHN